MDNPIVSIFLFVYNHEPYIAKGIESVLRQKTNYPYTLYIYDDFSLDGSSDIVQKYVDQNPKVVKLVKNTENFGINYQFEKAMLSAQTKYVCLSGGDDYWIDQYKLQKQLDFLEAHPDYTMVHTNCICLDEESGKESYKDKNWFWNMPDDRTDRLCSLFLNKMKGGYPEIIHSKVVGEGTTILSAIALYGGNIGYLPEPTVVYRIRKGSLSHKKNSFEQVRYLFSYTELRLKILKQLGIAQDKYFQVAKELFKVDIQTAIGLGAYREFEAIVNGCDLDKETENLFWVVYKRFHLINRYRFISRLVAWIFLVKNKISSMKFVVL